MCVKYIYISRFRWNAVAQENEFRKYSRQVRGPFTNTEINLDYVMGLLPET